MTNKKPTGKSEAKTKKLATIKKPTSQVKGKPTAEAKTTLRTKFHTKRSPDLIPVGENKNNRILRAVSKVSFRNNNQLAEAIKTSEYKAVELAPALQITYKKNRNQAVKMAEVFATTLSNKKDHRELFQSVALMEKDVRMVVIRGYRNAGEGRGVVHSISQLPRAQARTIMRDFVIK